MLVLNELRLESSRFKLATNGLTVNRTTTDGNIAQKHMVHRHCQKNPSFQGRILQILLPSSSQSMKS